MTDGHSTVSDPSPQTVQAVSITHNTYTTATTTPVYRPLFQDNLVSQYQKGKTSLDLYEARDDGFLGWQRHQLDHMQTTCISLETDNHTNTSSLNFYRPDALPDNKPIVSKHTADHRMIIKQKNYKKL